MHVQMYMLVPQYVCGDRSEENLEASVLSFHYGFPKIKIRLLGLMASIFTY